MVLWRFQLPIEDRLIRLVYAGSHWRESLRLAREAIASNDLPIQLIHAPTDKDLMQAAATADVAVPFMEKFHGKFLNEAKKLRLVIQFGVGLEGVDIQTATENGIAVSNIPANGTGNAESTAEHAIFLCISLLRRSQTDLVKQFNERQLGGMPAPRSLFRKRVTVVGYGSVGSKICEYLMAMGAIVTTVRRRNVHVNLPSLRVSTSLQDVLPTTDVLVLACPLTEETFHLVNRKTLALLPEGSLIVNVGRGPLVEHASILEALEMGKVGGFASDVGVGHESKVSEPWDPLDALSLHENALFTPHIGGSTDYCHGLMTQSILTAAQKVQKGDPPANWVNK